MWGEKSHSLKFVPKEFLEASEQIERKAAGKTCVFS